MSLVTIGFGLGIVLGLLSPVFFELPFLIGGLLPPTGARAVHRRVPKTVGSQ